MSLDISRFASQSKGLPSDVFSGPFLSSSTALHLESRSPNLQAEQLAFIPHVDVSVSVEHRRCPVNVGPSQSLPLPRCAPTS